MGIAIPYMGTKRQLAYSVAEVVRTAQPGIFFDAFSGMCSVGQQVATTRQIWTNDIQVFAAQVAAALFTSVEPSIRAGRVFDLLYDRFDEHRQKLRRRVTKSLKAERQALDCTSFARFEASRKALAHAFLAEAPRHPRRTGNLFLTRYANAFFGIRQSIEIDSIVHAIRSASQSRLISKDERRWLLIALGKVLLKASASPGHFAQFLKPKRTSFRTHIRQRRRRIWSEWTAELDDLCSIGDPGWRKNNRAFIRREPL